VNPNSFSQVLDQDDVTFFQT